jgi:hypothetical protein
MDAADCWPTSKSTIDKNVFLTGLSLNMWPNAHANPTEPRMRGADPKAHAFGRSVLSVLLGREPINGMRGFAMSVPSRNADICGLRRYFRVVPERTFALSHSVARAAVISITSWS